MTLLFILNFDSDDGCSSSNNEPISTIRSNMARNKWTEKSMGEYQLQIDQLWCSVVLLKNEVAEQE
jgi:hypothetical protein